MVDPNLHWNSEEEDEKQAEEEAQRLCEEEKIFILVKKINPRIFLAVMSKSTFQK